MKRVHIAIFNTPAPTTINPTLSIAATLIRRGYRVTYVTSERYRSMLSELGAEILLIPRIEFPFNQDTAVTAPIANQYCTDLVDLAARTLALVTEFYQRNVPDLVLYEAHAFAGLVVAEKLGARAIRLASNLALDEQALNQLPMSDAFRQSLNERRDRVDGFLRNCGVHRCDAILNREDPTIYFYVRELQLSPERIKHSSSFYAGRCGVERPRCGTWKYAVTDQRRTVLVSGSTTYVPGPAYYNMCLKAARELGWRAVLALDSNTDAAMLDPVPPDSDIVKGLPQILAMPYVDLLIGLGGPSTTMEALYYGLPCVMLTNGVTEAVWYADNVQRLGLGIHVNEENASADSIKRSMLAAVEDPELQARVKRMQRVVKRSSGGEEVVNWLEEQLEAMGAHPEVVGPYG